MLCFRELLPLIHGAVDAQVAGSTSSASSTGDATALTGTTGDGEIIVTARRRDETSIAVPVNLTAVGAIELQRRVIVNVDGLARIVPALIVGEGSGTVQGGIVAIRGISGSDSNPFGDQAVSFNIDLAAYPHLPRTTVKTTSAADYAVLAE